VENHASTFSYTLPKIPCVKREHGCLVDRVEAAYILHVYDDGRSQIFEVDPHHCTLPKGADELIVIVTLNHKLVWEACHICI